MNSKTDILKDLQDFESTSRYGQIPEDLRKISEAAFIARISPNTIRKRIRQGKLRRYGTPQSYCVSLSELLPCQPATQPLYTQQPKRSAEHLKKFRWSKGITAWNKGKSLRKEKVTAAPAIAKTAPEKSLTVQ